MDGESIFFSFHLWSKIRLPCLCHWTSYRIEPGIGYSSNICRSICRRWPCSYIYTRLPLVDDILCSLFPRSLQHHRDDTTTSRSPVFKHIFCSLNFGDGGIKPTNLLKETSQMNSHKSESMALKLPRSPCSDINHDSQGIQLGWSCVLRS